jgi:signal transduction histidine kinase
MGETPQSDTSNNENTTVPMRDVVRFIRQLSHDLRNSLNAAELQSAFLNEVAEDAEMKSELQRLRGMLASMAGNLQRLTGALAEINLAEMSYKAADLLEDLRGALSAEFPEQSGAITWDVEVGDAMLQVDPQLLQQALLELFANAFQHERGESQIEAKAETAPGQFVFTLHEPKTSFASSMEGWAREPFRRVRHGHYGLGLPRVRTIIEAHHGEFSARYDSALSSLVTTVALPMAGAK